MIPSHDLLLTSTSNMVICSFASGKKHERGLRLLMPTLEYYGKKFNIDTLVFTENFVPNKLAKRNKIFLLYNLLKYYEIVMWVDSDVIFVNPKEDIRNELNTEHLIYMANSLNKVPFFPNSGVIVIKRDPKVVKVLEEIWKYKRPKGRGWWDQQAILKLLGFKNSQYNVQSYSGPTEYTPLFGVLDNKWNSRPFDKDTVEQPIIEHYCGYHWKTRLLKMANGYQKFLKNIEGKQ